MEVGAKISSYSYKTSVTHLLQQLQVESLEERRKVEWLAFVYKILNGQVNWQYQQLLSTLSCLPDLLAVQVQTNRN